VQPVARPARRTSVEFGVDVVGDHEPGEQPARRPVTAVALAVLVMVAALATAVSLGAMRGSGPAPTGASAGLPTAGTVSGRVLQYGGPLTPDGRQALNGAPAPGVVVAATQRGEVVAKTTAGADGGYSLALAPGTYTITGCDPTSVVVTAAATTSADLTCPVP
jgi:hypothetical protein